MLKAFIIQWLNSLFSQTFCVTSINKKSDNSDPVYCILTACSQSSSSCVPLTIVKHCTAWLYSNNYNSVSHYNLNRFTRMFGKLKYKKTVKYGILINLKIANRIPWSLEYPLKCFTYPQGARILKLENHCFNKYWIKLCFTFIVFVCKNTEYIRNSSTKNSYFLIFFIYRFRTKRCVFSVNKGTIYVIKYRLFPT